MCTKPNRDSLCFSFQWIWWNMAPSGLLWQQAECVWRLSVRGDIPYPTEIHVNTKVCYMYFTYTMGRGQCILIIMNYMNNVHLFLVWLRFSMPQTSGKATLPDTIPENAFPTLGSLAPAYKPLKPFWDAGNLAQLSSLVLKICVCRCEVWTVKSVWCWNVSVIYYVE